MTKYTKRDNFVAPVPQPRVEIVESSPAQLPAPPSTVLLPTANYTDRARGFSLATAPLAGVAGLVAALVGILGWQVPIASLATLLLALGGFALVWLAAYIAHTLISPDGATFFHVLLAWRFLRAEQKERIRRYREVSHE
jgi:hypothetical protein